jgi:hypothetical protein
MKISSKRLKQLICEEIQIIRIETKGQFGYIMQTIMDNPDEPISDDLYEPVKGKLILRKGGTFKDISADASYILLRDYNIDISPPEYIRRPTEPKPDRGVASGGGADEPSARTGPTDVQSVASSLSGYVGSGSPPLRNDIKSIVADQKRGEIAVYLRGPSERMASDQQIACALRFLLDKKVKSPGRYIINPCGYGPVPKNDLIVIVKM